MTWSIFTSTTNGLRGGSAEVRYRLKIAGLPYEGVTHIEMARAATWSANKPERLHGLVIRGQKLGYKSDFLTGKLTGQGLTVGFVDMQNATRKNSWTYLFNRQPSQTTWLGADLAVGGTTVTVTATAGFASAGMLWVDGEAIYYPTVGSGTTFTTASRGWFGTQAAAHYNGTGAGLRSPEVTDWPQLIEGRRAYLYAYGDNDDVQGDGTLIWQGITLSEPSFNGVQWTLQLDSLVSILKQNVGGDLLGSIAPRGILYPDSEPFVLSFNQGTTSSCWSVGTTFGPAVVSGFYENNDTFCDAVNTAIISAIGVGTFYGQLKAVSDGPTGWHFEYLTDSVNNFGLRLLVTSKIDGPFGGGGGDWTFPQVRTYSSGSTTYVLATVDTVAASAAYYFQPDTSSPMGASSVPRGILDTGAAMYVNNPLALPYTATTALIDWPEFSGLQPKITQSYAITATDTTNRKLTLDPGTYTFPAGTGPTPTRRYWTAGVMPVIRIGIALNEVPTGVAGGTAGTGNSLYNLLRKIYTLGPTVWNLGLLPQVVSSDFDTTAFSALSAPGMSPLVAARSYDTFVPHTLEEIMIPELMLAGYFLTINSSGAISIKPMRLPAASEAYGATAIGSSDILNDSEKLTFERGGMSLCNTATITTGYNPSTDDFTDGRIYRVRNVAAFSQSVASRVIEVKPLSGYAGPKPITDAMVVGCLSTVLGVLGRSYSLVTLDVSARLWNVTIGDPVALTYALAPNDDGTQGVTTKVGIVTGWEADTYSPRVRLTILMTMQSIGGYAPAAIMTAKTNTSGNTWSLTLGADFCPSGRVISDFFAAGDRVTINRYDNAGAASRVAGVVVSSTATGAVVTFDGVWTPSTDAWYLTIADADDASLTTREKKFIHIADSSKHVNYASGDVPAWRLGP